MSLIGYYPRLVRRGVFKGVDLKSLADRLWRLDSMRAEKKPPPIRWRASKFGGAAGIAYKLTYGISIRLAPDASIESAAETVLHELVHCSLPYGESHGDSFKHRLIACANEAFGLELNASMMLALPKSNYKVQAYAIDARITEVMRWLTVGQSLRADTDYEAAMRQAEAENCGKLTEVER